MLNRAIVYLINVPNNADLFHKKIFKEYSFVNFGFYTFPEYGIKLLLGLF